jgi:O-antigen/teichoic acid export membrane protein
MWTKVLHTFFSRGMNAVLNFLLVLLTARWLGAEVRGEISLLVATLNLSLLAVGFLGGSTVISLMPHFRASAVYKYAFAWMLLVSLVSYPVLAGLEQSQGVGPGHWTLLLLLFNAANLNRYTLLAFKAIETDNKLGMAFGVLQLVLLAVLVGGGVNRDLMLFVWLLIAANAALWLVSSLLLLKYWPAGTTLPIQGVFKAMLRQGFWAQTANLTQFASYRVSYYLIEQAAGTSALGIYGIAVALAESLWIISRSVSLVQMSEVANSANEQLQFEMTTRWSRLTVWITILVLLPLLLLPDVFFRNIFGVEFTGLSKLLWILAPGILALSASNLVSHYFAGKGNYQRNAIISLSTLVVVLGLLPPLMASYGIQGAALAQSIAYLTGWLVAAWLFDQSAPGAWKGLVPRLADVVQAASLLQQQLVKYKSRSK